MNSPVFAGFMRLTKAALLLNNNTLKGYSMRIRSQYLIKKKARIILLAHLGRPKGKVNKALSLKPIAIVLSKLLKRKILFSSETLDSQVQKKVQRLKDGQVLLLENLRFQKGEESNNISFAKKLSLLGDL